MVNSKLSVFEEKSRIDQDDSYGNYKPKYLTKKFKVTGKAGDIMQL